MQPPSKDPNVMQAAPLLLLGSGRSGTTLVQRILNTLPGVIVWGEHGGALTHLADMYFYLRDNPSMHEYCYEHRLADDKRLQLEAYRDSSVWQAWMNWFEPQDLKAMFRQFVESIFSPQEMPDIKVWGFKEIRYGRDDRVVELLIDLYPELRVIAVVREPLNTIESQVTTFHQGESRFPRLKRLLQLPLIYRLARRWRDQNQELKALAATHGDNIKLFRYEDTIEDLSCLNDAIGPLGFSIGETQMSVLAEKAGRGSGFSPSASVHERWRRMGIIPAYVIEVLVGKTAVEMNYERPAALAPATRLSTWL